MLHNPCGVCYGAGVYLDSSVDSSVSSEIFLILRNHLNIIINVHRSICEVPLFLSGFNQT